MGLILFQIFLFGEKRCNDDEIISPDPEYTNNNYFVVPPLLTVCIIIYIYIYIIKLPYFSIVRKKVNDENKKKKTPSTGFLERIPFI